MSKIQEKPLALKGEHQHFKTSNFCTFYFYGSFLLSWIWTRVQLTKINADSNVFQFPSVADPDLGSGAILTPGSGMNIPNHISESVETIFWF
jgi:hypothetical protein